VLVPVLVLVLVLDGSIASWSRARRRKRAARAASRRGRRQTPVFSRTEPNRFRCRFGFVRVPGPAARFRFGGPGSGPAFQRAPWAVWNPRTWSATATSSMTRRLHVRRDMSLRAGWPPLPPAPSREREGVASPVPTPVPVPVLVLVLDGPIASRPPPESAKRAANRRGRRPTHPSSREPNRFRFRLVRTIQILRALVPPCDASPTEAGNRPRTNTLPG
jgi:hypothetical protein